MLTHFYTKAVYALKCPIFKDLVALYTVLVSLCCDRDTIRYDVVSMQRESQVSKYLIMLQYGGSFQWPGTMIITNNSNFCRIK